MQPQDDKQLWELLNGTSQMQVPANFTNNVLHRIRLENSDKTEVKFSAWLGQSWRLITGLTTGAAVLVSMLLFQENYSGGYSLALSDKPEHSKLIASVPFSDLDEFSELDISIDDNDLWLDISSY